MQEVLNEMSPIEDAGGTMSLSFKDYTLDDPRYTIEECRDKDLTYYAPMFVTAEFITNETGEIKTQTVFMGNFPLMTPRGTFIINGTERVVVSQLVRSPGVYFEKTGQRHLRRQGNPFTRGVAGTGDRQARHRGGTHRPQAQTVRHYFP